MNDFHPLVSVIVVTYNSELTVLDTLKSIANQTYENIEVIISDDCSSDNTIDVVESWISSNYKFARGIKFLKSESNQGVCKNLNKAVRCAAGSHIKIIAGDDMLFPNCCKDYVQYIKENRSAKFVTSFVKVFNKNFDNSNCINSQEYYVVPKIFHQSVSIQLKRMAYSIFVSAPTMFFSKELFDMIGGFDEQYSYEDHPFYMNILEAGEKIYFCPKVTVGYRIHQSTYNSDTKLFNFVFAQQSKLFRKERCFKYYGFRQKLAVCLYYKLLVVFERLKINKNTRILASFYKLLTGVIWAIGK